MRLSVFVPFAGLVQAGSEFYCLGDAEKGATTVSLTSDESYCRLRPRDDAPHKVRLKMAGLSDSNSCTEDEDRIFITSNGSLLGPLCPKMQEKHILDWFKEEVEKESIYDAIFDATETTMIFVPGNKGDSSAQQVMLRVAWENIDSRLSSDHISASSTSNKDIYIPSCSISTFADSFVQAKKAKLQKLPKKILRKIAAQFNDLFDKFEDHSDFCQENAIAVDCSIFEENDGGTKIGIFTALREIVKHVARECSTDSHFVKGLQDDLERLIEISGYEIIEETTEMPSTTEIYTTTTLTTTTTATSSTSSTTTTTSTAPSASTSTTSAKTSTTTYPTTTNSKTTTDAQTTTTDYTTARTSTTSFHPATTLPLEITAEQTTNIAPEEERLNRGETIAASSNNNSRSMCKIRNMPERFNTIFSARAQDLRKSDLQIVKKAVVTVSKSFKYCDQGHVLCELILMNRKMHSCQLVNSLDNILQFLSSEGSCNNNWLNDVAQKIVNAQMVFDMDNCPAEDDILPIERMKDMNEKFFENGQRTLQEALLEVADRKVPLSHRSWIPKIRLTMKTTLSSLENPEDTLEIPESALCSIPRNKLQEHCGHVFTRFIDSLRQDSSASEQTVEMTSGMMARALRKFRLNHRRNEEVKIICTDLRLQLNLQTSYLDVADSVYRMIRVNNSR